MRKHQMPVPSFLVAMPHLNDPCFKRSVVLLVEHSPEGALGFIVNRMGNVALAEILEFEGHEIPVELKAWFGGPVDPGSGVILAHSRDADTKIADGVCLATSDIILSDLIETSRMSGGLAHDTILNQYSRRQVLYPYRFLVGYSGWGAKQLDEEIRLGSWIQLDLDHELLFDVPKEQMWDAAMQRLGIHASSLSVTSQPYLN